jgi:hypothetical protein
MVFRKFVSDCHKFHGDKAEILREEGQQYDDIEVRKHREHIEDDQLRAVLINRGNKELLFVI